MNKRKIRIFTLVRRLESKELQEVKHHLDELSKYIIDLRNDFETQKLDLFNSPEENIRVFNENPHVRALPQKISLEHQLVEIKKHLKL